MPAAGKGPSVKGKPKIAQGTDGKPLSKTLRVGKVPTEPMNNRAGTAPAAGKTNKVGEEKKGGKKTGVDGKECWDGYKYAGKERKPDGTYKDICKPMSAAEKNK